MGVGAAAWTTQYCDREKGILRTFPQFLLVVLQGENGISGPVTVVKFIVRLHDRKHDAQRYELNCHTLKRREGIYRTRREQSASVARIPSATYIETSANVKEPSGW